MKLKGGLPQIRLDNNPKWTTQERYSIIADMINTSPQIEGLLNSIKDPILTAIWKVQPNNASDAITKFVQDWIFNKLDFYGVLPFMLKSLEYGVMPFEKEYIVENSKDYVLLHARMPYTIIQWNVDFKKGKLVSVVQQTTYGSVEIPVKRLFLIVNDPEGITPIGKSVLRSLYRAFVLSVEIEEAAATGLKRNLMGVPVANYPDSINGDDEKQILSMLENVAVSDKGYFAEKGDVHFRFQAVEGKLPDPNGMLSYFWQSINTSQSANMLSLATTNRGSRAVGGTLAPPFYNRIAAIARNISYNMNKLIKEVVDMNFNTDTYPQLVASGISAKDFTEKAYAMAAVRDFLQTMDAKEQSALKEYILDAFEIPH